MNKGEQKCQTYLLTEFLWTTLHLRTLVWIILAQLRLSEEGALLKDMVLYLHV